MRGFALLDEAQLELEKLQAELEEYQRVIDEIPGIFEQKFQVHLHDVVQDLHRLTTERNSLLEILGAWGLVPQQPLADVLPPHRFPVLSWRFCRFMPQLRVAVARLPWPVWLASGVAVGGLSFLLRLPVAPPSAPERAAPSSDIKAAPSSSGDAAEPSPPALPAAELSQLRLRATGEAWLIVEAPDGEVLYEGTLQKGQNTAIERRPGLRVRSGRPDLVEFAAGDQPFQTLGNFGDYGWRTVTPADQLEPSS